MSLRPPLADVTNKSRKRAGNTSDDVVGTKENNFGDKLFMTGNVKKKHSVESLAVAGQVEGVDDLDVDVVGITEGARQVDVVSRGGCCSVPCIVLGGSDSCIANSSNEAILQENASINNSQIEFRNGDKNLTLPCFNIDQIESTKSAKSVKPRKLNSFELERCSSLKGDNEPNSDADTLKTCSCSFCLKAAYMWSDLQYQDVKGRISVAKKSKTEAFNLFQRIPTDKEAETTDQGKYHSTSKLESELFNQWRLLFLHMEESYTRERNQLQGNFQALKQLRENCKVNLEMIDAKPADHD